ncbi:EamA family transporter RarD [Terasakiella sp.]|uniref:EamA family transporter RarD n=1 Tax=Terasakiella sp. TaxID=2034861 RepID=UPI003AA8F7AE
MTVTSPSDSRLAVISAMTAYMFWGMFGLYFKALDVVSPIEILAHRIVWSFLLLAVLITYSGNWVAVMQIVRSPRKLIIFALSASLIALNWGFYIYAVVSRQALEGSMGYFIMPLVAVMLGAVFFAERFSRTQAFAIALALCGVVYQLWFVGQLPWIALILACSFGTYGMLRKKAPAESTVGLFLETALITPFALAYMVYLSQQDALYFTTGSWDMSLLLMLAGPITAIPLILFGFGARKLRYSTVGLLQYINPTCQFLLAIFIFEEPFSLHNLITFALIWCGLALYSVNTLHQRRQIKSSQT